MTYTGEPQRVVFLTSDMPFGGAETIMVSLVNSLDRRRFTPIVVSLAGPGESEKGLSPDVEIVHFPRRSRFDFAPAKELRGLMLQRNVATLLAKGSFCFLFAKLALRGVPSPPRLLVWLHTTKPRSPREYVFDLALWRWLSGEETLLTVCESQARFLSRRYFIPARMFHTIYNGVDTDWWTLPPSDFARPIQREQYGIPADAFVIVHVAMFRKEKRQDDALRALSIVHATSNARPYLLFVGDGEESVRETLHRLSTDLGVSEYVRFCGSQQDVRPFYWLSDLFVLTSVSETFSMAALEAMATGLPCVLPDLGGAREMVVEGLSGFCVRPGDPRSIAESWVRTLFARGDFSPMRIRQGVVDRFSFPQCLQKYEDLLSGGLTD
jgi:glycosyltransferase involved in cell wall biosynthesis